MLTSVTLNEPAHSMREPIIEALFLTSLAVFGLLFGSFANVVIWRFPRGESLSVPASHCPACETPIRWRDNIPVVSWLLLRGHCRTCGIAISGRYPTVELLSCALWLLAGVRFGIAWQTAAAVFFFYLLMILAFIDMDTMRLPNRLVAILALGGLLGAAIAQVADVALVPLVTVGGALGASPLVAALAGAFMCAAVALTLSLVMEALLKRPALGMGDVKLLGVIGLYLSSYGLMVLFVGSVFGLIYGVIVQSRAKNADENSPATGKTLGGAPYPFGPALALGAVVVALVGPQMWSWYQSLFM